VELSPLARKLVLLLLVVVVPIGLVSGLGYFALGLGAKYVTCDQWMLGKAGVCHPPTGEPYYICAAASRDEVESSDGCTLRT
jgi:hypothetical protein